MTTANLFGKITSGALSGTPINWPGDTFKVALLTSSYVPSLDTHDFFNDVSAFQVTGTGYTSGGFTLTNPVVKTFDPIRDETTYDADDLVVAAVTYTNMRYAVLYKDTGSAATSPLMVLFDFVTPSNSVAQPFSLVWPVVGVFTIRASALTPAEYAEASAVAAAASAQAWVSSVGVVGGSTVVQLGHPSYGLPTPGTSANAAFALAYAATPVGGTLDCGDRDITLTAQISLNKRITLQRGRFIGVSVRPFLVTAAGFTFDRVTVTRTGPTGVGGVSGDAITFNAANGRVLDCTVSSTAGAAIRFQAGNCNGSRIKGGTFSSSNADDASVIEVLSGADNNDIKVEDAIVRHTGAGCGVVMYNMSGGVVQNCDIRGIRATPWQDLGPWTNIGGTVWTALDRTDTDSNIMYVGSIADWDHTKVIYEKGGVYPSPILGEFALSDDSGGSARMVALNIATDPNTLRVRTRRTNGYGILMYSKNPSDTTGMHNNLIAQNFVKDTDGFGIYYQVLNNSPQTNRTHFNILEDVCLLGVGVQALPFAGIGVFGGNNTILHGDIVRRAGSALWPAPGVRLTSSADSPDASARMTNVFVTGASGSGFSLNKGHWVLHGCTSEDNAGAGYATGTQEAADWTGEFHGCDARRNGAGGFNLAGTGLSTRVAIFGGEVKGNLARGLNLNRIRDSRIIGLLINSNSVGGMNITGTSRNLYIAGVSISGFGIAVSSEVTGLTLIPGTDDGGAGTKYDIQCAFWKTGDNQFTGSGSPETVVTAPIGATYRRRDGSSGTTFYVKESGAGTTGWVAK